MAAINYFIVQKVIYEKLIANTTLMAIITGVFDNVPAETLFPYVTISGVSANDLSSLGKYGVEYNFTLNIWSREAGHKQAASITDIIYGLLHNGSLTIAGYNIISMYFASSSIELESDGVTYKGTMRLKIFTTVN